MKKIVVIDDQRDILSFLEKSLRGAGYDVVSLQVTPRVEDLLDEKADVVLIDLLMPERMGYELGRHIIEARQGNSPRVALISGRNEDILRKKAEEIGADGYLAKPFSLEDLFALIENIVDEK